MAQPSRVARGAGALDEEALCQALGIERTDESTRTFLVLVRHDLLYLTDQSYRKLFDERLEKQWPRRKPRSVLREICPSRKRGRPRDEVARSLVSMFRSRLESVLGFKLGFSKRGGKLHRALSIYLKAAGKSAPDRHVQREEVLLFDAERLIYEAPSDEPPSIKSTRAKLRLLAEITKALTSHRR
jgi:hypothetical protein